MLALLFFGWIFPIGLHDANGDEKFFIFLTSWAYVVYVGSLIWSAFSSTLTFVCSNFCCADQFGEKFTETMNGRHSFELILDTKPVGCCWCGVKTDQTLWHQKILWILNSIAVVLAIGVSVLYWALLYDPDTVDELNYEIDGGLNLMTHGINGLAALIDIFISGIPYRLLHFIYPVAFTSTYCRLLLYNY